MDSPFERNENSDESQRPMHLGNLPPSSQRKETPACTQSYTPSPGTLRNRQSTPYPQTADSLSTNRMRKPIIRIPVQSTLKRSSDQFSTPEPRVVRPRLASSISSPQGLGGSVNDNMSEMTPVESDRESTMQNVTVSGGVRGRARTVQSPSAKAGRVKDVAMLQQLRAEKQDVMAQLDRVRGEINTLQKQNKQLISDVHAYRDAAVAREHSPEQNHPQALFSRADSYSCFDIISLVDALNGEIMQLSALMSDELKFLHPPKQCLLDGMKATVDCASEQLGIHFVLLLRGTRNRDTHRGLVRIALQAVLAQTCATIIQRWSVVDERTNTFLSELYKGFEEISMCLLVCLQYVQDAYFS
ncbi:hypothetical protein ARMSODRAFT_1022209 [Armillaria solidipes]|uniref:Uncharacterized protein n=1 Tax=Armillaria solidipes TaxID=1076256 RepID=A0A2H3B6T8_9AGAR|nr:hypothetical protein ARMSODRAFT_1022209 [Armillaria solidipes]